MTRNNADCRQKAAPSAEAFAVFGPPPLLDGEKREAYEQLLERIAADVGPESTIEMMWVRDIVDLVWETLRYRRFRSLIIDAAREEALRFMLGLHFMAAKAAAAEPRADGAGGATPEADDDADELGDITGAGAAGRMATRLAAGWWQDPAAKDAVSKILEQHQLSEETITAEAYRRRGEDIDRIEKLLVSAEVRRNKVLKEIAKHRKSLADAARASAERVMDDEAAGEADSSLSERLTGGWWSRRLAWQ